MINRWKHTHAAICKKRVSFYADTLQPENFLTLFYEAECDRRTISSTWRLCSFASLRETDDDTNCKRTRDSCLRRNDEPGDWFAVAGSCFTDSV